MNISYASPLILPHLEHPANRQATVNPKSVTNDNIQNPSVPPALDKVRQQMGERQLGDLPHAANRPQNTRVPDQNRLEQPPQIVAQRKHVDVAPDPFERDVRAVDAVLAVHVDAEVRQLRVQEEEDVAGRRRVLEQQEQDGHQVEDAQAEHYAPYRGMGADEGAVGKREHGNDHEEEQAA